MLVLLADLALTICSPHHYTVDVATALPLTLMVYGSPAIAVAADWWAQICSAEDEAPLAAGSTPVSPVSLAPGPTRNGPSGTGPSDLGVVTVPPCMVPFCSLGGLYYLRDEPGALSRRPWNEESQRMHERQVAEFGRLSEVDAGRRRQVEEAVEEERRRAKMTAGEAAVRVDVKLEEKERQLAAEEDRVFSQARHRLELERKATASAGQKAEAGLTQLSSRDLTAGVRRARRTGELDQARQLAREAQDSSAARAAAVAQCTEEVQALRTLLGRLQADGCGPASPSKRADS